MPPADHVEAPSALPCPPDRVDEFLSQPSEAVIATLARHPGPVHVLGAGGKMGLHLSMMLRRALDRAGRRDVVTAVSRFRTLRDRATFEDRGITTLACDLTDPAAVAALPDAATVFFMAGVKFGTASAPDLLQKFNVEMPRLVANRFQRSRIVAFSTGCVYPFVTRASGGATESTPPAPVGDYAASCYARETAFSEVSRQHGTLVALIRLNYSVEFRYGLLVDIAEKVLRNEPVDVTTGYFNIIWQRDAVEYAIRALEVAGSPAVPINITGPQTLSVREIAAHFGELFQRKVAITGAEADTAWLNNAASSHRRFGPPATSLDDMLVWVAAWLRHGGETWGKPTGFEQRNGQF